MPASAERAWELLQDIERVAACMPGARITERVDERHYKGAVSVRFGPASLAFRGTVELTTIEPVSRTLRLLGKGTDTSGGAASLELTAHVEPVDASSCNLAGRSEVSLSGKVATFGARMADAVAEQVLGQFAANFAAALRAQASAPAEAAAPAAAAAARPEASLNGLALVWAIVRGWLRGLGL